MAGAAPLAELEVFALALPVAVGDAERLPSPPLPPLLAVAAGDAEAEGLSVALCEKDAAALSKDAAIEVACKRYITYDILSHLAALKRRRND